MTLGYHVCIRAPEIRYHYSYEACLGEVVEIGTSGVGGMLMKEEGLRGDE